MTYDAAGRRTAEARALIAAIAIAGEARWPLDRAGPLPSRSFRHHLYVECAQLLLMPVAEPLERAMAVADRAMREARSDALVVSAAHRSAPGVAFALALWGLHENAWHAPVALWRRPGSGTWLVPEPYHAGVRHSCFRLEHRRLRAVGRPWRSEDEHRTGRARGDAWIANVLERR